MHISHGGFCFFNLGCESLGERFGGGDLFPNLIGEPQNLPNHRVVNSQFFFAGGKNDLATKKYQIEWNISTKENVK